MIKYDAKSYATLDDYFLRWGAINGLDAANFDRLDMENETERRGVLDRICKFLVIATADIDSRIREAAYAVSMEPPFDPIIVNICAEMAYIKLYKTRHSTDGTDVNPFQMEQQQHDQWFKSVIARSIRLNEEQHTTDIPQFKRDKQAPPIKQTYESPYKSEWGKLEYRPIEWGD